MSSLDIVVPFKIHWMLVVVFQSFPVAEKFTRLPAQISVSLAVISTVGSVVTMVSMVTVFELATAALVQMALLLTVQVIF